MRGHHRTGVTRITMANLLAHTPVPVLVHVLEDLLQRSLLAHELAEGKTTIKISIHPIKELGHLRPELHCVICYVTYILTIYLSAGRWTPTWRSHTQMS